MMKKNFFIGRACLLTMMGLSSLASTAYASLDFPGIVNVQ